MTVPRTLSRRDVAALGLAALSAAPVLVRAQRVRRVGFLNTTTAAEGAAYLDAFRSGLRELGYVEGRDIVIEQRWADNRYEQLPALANDLAQKGAEVIVSVGTPGSRAARDARPAVPVVMVTAGDPVALGFAETLARPGKTVTGVTASGPQITVKWMDLVRDVLPNARRLAYLANPLVRTTTAPILLAEAAKLGFTLEMYYADSPDQLEGAVRAMAAARREVVLLQLDLMITSHAARIARAALQQRIACIGGGSVARDGGLLGYAANTASMFREAAPFVDKILRGARAGELPIQQARRYELVVNLRTAQALGITVPQSVLVSADEVIS